MGDPRLRFSVLGSGSGGNCTAIVLNGCPPRVILIDLGLSPRQTRKRLQAVGLTFGEVTDVVLTHLDSDHFQSGWATALHHADRVTVRVHQRHASMLRATGLHPARMAPMDDDGVVLEPERTHLAPIHLPHDRTGAFGYLLEHEGARFGYATDLGRVTDDLLRAFDPVDALALESNYDPALQHASNRPDFLKRRIMGGAGHLSNEECLEAARRIDARQRLEHLALLHLSRQCNCPHLVQRLYAERAPSLIDRLVITSQHTPTPLLPVRGRAPRAAPLERVPATLFG